MRASQMATPARRERTSGGRRRRSPSPRRASTGWSPRIWTTRKLSWICLSWMETRMLPRGKTCNAQTQRDESPNLGSGDVYKPKYEYVRKQTSMDCKRMYQVHISKYVYVKLKSTSIKYIFLTWQSSEAWSLQYLYAETINKKCKVVCLLIFPFDKKETQSVFILRNTVWAGRGNLS